MIKFINKFINKSINNNITNDFLKLSLNKKKIYEDSLIYSKYYLYYIIMKCIYSPEIMNIIYDIEYN